MTYEQCKQKMLKAHPDSILVGSFKIPSGFIFSLKPEEWKDQEYVLGGLFKVTLEGVIAEYSPVMNPEEFKEALKNRVE